MNKSEIFLLSELSWSCIFCNKVSEEIRRLGAHDPQINDSKHLKEIFKEYLKKYLKTTKVGYTRRSRKWCRDQRFRSKTTICRREILCVKTQNHIFSAIMIIFGKEKIENARSIGLGHFQKYWKCTFPKNGHLKAPE